MSVDVNRDHAVLRAQRPRPFERHSAFVVSWLLHAHCDTRDLSGMHAWVKNRIADVGPASLKETALALDDLRTINLTGAKPRMNL